MGYNLYITRKKDYLDKESSDDISLNEWFNYVKNDSDMRIDNFMEAKLAEGDILRLDEEGISVWKKYSKDGVNGSHAWFWYDNGNIVVKNPDLEIRQKMVDVSKKLNAYVQGEEGEIYN